MTVPRFLGTERVPTEGVAVLAFGPRGFDALIVLVDEIYDDPSAVLRDADAAMYAAKQAGKSRTQVFEGRAAR